jgi:protein SHQ1
MPLLPRFFLSQSPDHVSLVLKVPYVRVSTAELVIDGRDLSFYCRPYLLKLSFPGDFTDDADQQPARYDPDDDHGTLTLTLPKKNPREHFVGLDLLSSLIKVKKVDDLLQMDSKQYHGDQIEVLHSEHYVEDTNDTVVDNTANSSNLSDIRNLFPPKTHGYGFLRRYIGTLEHREEDCAEVWEETGVHRWSAAERRWKRIMKEYLHFDASRYLADTLACTPEVLGMDSTGSGVDSTYSSAMRFVPPWQRHYDAYIASRKADSTRNNSHADNKEDSNATMTEEMSREKLFKEVFGGFSDADQAQLLAVRKRKEKHGAYFDSVVEKEKGEIMLLLVDVLFAAAYELRVSHGLGEDGADSGELSVEQAMNVVRLSPSLSWLDSPYITSTSIADAAVDPNVRTLADCYYSTICYSVRRALTYTYLRTFKLARKALVDVVRILYGGRRLVLKLLLSLHRTCDTTGSSSTSGSGGMYLLNELFLDDLCYYIHARGVEIEKDLTNSAVLYNEAKNRFEGQSSGTSSTNQGKDCVGLNLVKLEEYARAAMLKKKQSEECTDSTNDDSDDEEEDSDSNSDSSDDDDDDSTSSNSDSNSSNSSEDDVEDDEIPADLRTYDVLTISEDTATGGLDSYLYEARGAYYAYLFQAKDANSSISDNLDSGTSSNTSAIGKVTSLLNSGATNADVDKSSTTAGNAVDIQIRSSRRINTEASPAATSSTTTSTTSTTNIAATASGSDQTDCTCSTSRRPLIEVISEESFHNSTSSTSSSTGSTVDIVQESLSRGISRIDILDHNDTP